MSLNRGSKEMGSLFLPNDSMAEIWLRSRKVDPTIPSTRRRTLLHKKRVLVSQVTARSWSSAIRIEPVFER